MKQAYCSECHGYVYLDDAGLCPGQHPRPSYRDVRDVTPQAAAPPPQVLAPPSLSAGSRLYEGSGGSVVRFAVLSVGLVAMLVGGIIYFRLQRISLLMFLPAAYFGSIAIDLARKPAAVVDASGIVVWSVPFKRQAFRWSDVIGFARAGRLMRMSLRDGSAVGIDLDAIRPDRREAFVGEIRTGLGSLWSDADDPQFASASRQLGTPGQWWLFAATLALAVGLVGWLVLSGRGPSYLEAIRLSLQR